MRGSAGNSAETEPATSAVTTTEAVTTEAPTTVAATSTTSTTSTSSTTSTTIADRAEWVTHSTEAPCQCADGSEYVFHTLDRDPDKVTTGIDDHPTDESGGIWDDDNPNNPFADWSVVFMPYCTGDVFLGDASTTYGDDLVIEHRGAPDAQQLFVTGSSAGGVPAPLIGGLASDVLSNADIAVLADASGGYPSNPLTNSVIGTLWGTASNIPDWPELEGLDPDIFGIPDLFRYSGQHDPSIRMARYDNAFDQVQESFSRSAGIEGGLLAVLDANEAMIEVEGVAFIDWLNTFVDGESPGDAHCVECETG